MSSTGLMSLGVYETKRQNVSLNGYSYSLQESAFREKECQTETFIFAKPHDIAQKLLKNFL